MNDDLVNSIQKNLYIGGDWRESSDKKRFDVLDPATEKVITTVASATTNDALAAVASAYDAGPEWAAAPPIERANILLRSYELMMERANDYATIISREEGKTLAEGLGEVNYAASFMRWYGEEAVRYCGRFGRAPAGTNNILVQHKPVGVSFLITPWNFPAAMATRKIAPALAAGCTTILKPASETPLTALMLASLYEEAGVPPGVVNVIPSRRTAKISNAIMSDDRTRKVSFTGSTEVGRILLAKAAERIINCSMELGGNAPFIVLDDANVDESAEAALVAKIRSTGESCIAANRFYVHTSKLDEFSDRLSKAMSALKVGPGLEPGIDVGPLVNAVTRDKVENLVGQAVRLGATVLTGGRRVGDLGYFYEPTVIVDIPAEADILHTEIFGPVATIVPFDDDDQVVEMANNTIFGLAAYVCGRDIRRALNIADRIDAGIIGINRGFVSDASAPFGGFKQSGLGREGSQDGMHEFLETKYVAVDW